MGESGAAQRVDRLLKAAYPDKRGRARAIRWLGWIAHRVPDRPDFGWKDIPAKFRTPAPSPRLRRLFDDACEHGVLSREAADYRFADAAVQADLAAAYEALPTGTAGTVFGFLAEGHQPRLIADGIACVGVIAVVGWQLWSSPPPSNLGALLLFIMVVGILIVGFSGFVVWMAAGLVTAVAKSVAASPKLTRPQRAGWAAATVAAIGVITAFAGLARAVPAALVAACGLLVCVLIGQLAHATRIRWRKAVLRPLVDVVAIATVSAGVLVLSENDLLTTQPAAGFLFPLAVWGSVRVWQAMAGSDRLPTRAAADIVLSLLLGGVLVVFLVWLGDTFGLPRTELAAWRALLERTGDLADLPWWFWVTVYVLLAGLYVAFVHWPARMAPMIKRFRRLRVVPVTNASRRMLTGAHIGLLAIVLVGLAAPVTLTVTVPHQLAALYQVAVRREFEADGELLAYQEIRQRFSSGVPAANEPLTDLVLAIVDHDTPMSDSDSTASEDTAIAQGFGQLQAATLHLAASQALAAAEQSAVRAAGLDAPVRDAADATHRVDEVEAEQDRADTAANNAELAGDLAATAVAGSLSAIAPSKAEVFEVAREYLSGLVEGSRIKDMVAGLTEHLAGARTPPDAESMVVPDPDQLEKTALADLSGGLDPATVADAKTQPPLDSAAELIQQTHADQTNNGGCAGCGSGGGQDEDDVPVEDPVIIDEGG